jgi:hypothetical protein
MKEEDDTYDELADNIIDFAEYGIIIMDDDKGRGIIIEIDIGNGMTLTRFIPDSIAQEMVNLIQNKLNARV